MVHLKNNESKVVYVPDVNKVIEEVEQIKKESNVTLKPHIPDVDRDSIFLTTILPMLLLGVVVVVVLMMMNANAGGGGGKMANFGKSRARMVIEIKNMDFSKVAGLEEEKEELVRKSTEYYSKNAKPGSMMAKANMVKQYNEKNNK